MRCFWNLHQCMFSLPFPLSSEGSIFPGLQLGFNQITLSSFKMTTLCSRQRDRSVWQDSPKRLSEDYQQQVIITRIKILPRPEWPSYARLGTVNAISSLICVAIILSSYVGIQDSCGIFYHEIDFYFNKTSQILSRNMQFSICFILNLVWLWTGGSFDFKHVPQ